ncbi:MAG: alpha-L-fucosidase [Clostridium sp.]|nr:alpha-L-fucosidase [Clostridium sp.]
MNKIFEKDWSNYNNGYPLNNSETERYISVVPSENQLRHQSRPYYCFIHFGMNTATAREWGNGKETVDDFTIKSIDAKQWVRTIKNSGATGIILTCKHHDGFCLWESAYTDFCIKNTTFEGDIVKMVSEECHKQGMDFGVYLSPWDMHDARYGTEAYNDYFCNQLTELLTNYGDVFEVWFDGAKGKEAAEFEYDWQRIFSLVHKLQPKANMAICGPDIRWVGNEGGKSRTAEYSVVPFSLTSYEAIKKKSQNSEAGADELKKIASTDEDLGSRKILEKSSQLCWYPAEVDVSIRKGWFYSKDENRTVKSAEQLFDIYIKSVGNNCALLLNVPPTDTGVIHSKDAKVLKKLGSMIQRVTAKPIAVKEVGALTADNSYVELNFNAGKRVNYIVVSEDTQFSQRVEAFDIYLKKSNGKYSKIYSGTIIGSKKIIRVKNKKCVGAALVIRQSRSNPHIKEIGIYE